MSTTTDRAGPEDLSEAEQVAIALGRDDQVSRKAALDLIQDLRHRAASTFTPAYSGSLGQARCDSFFEAYEALRLMPPATGEAPASTSDADGDLARLSAATKAECVLLAGSIRQDFGKLADAHGDLADDLDDTCDRIVDRMLAFLAARKLPAALSTTPAVADITQRRCAGIRKAWEAGSWPDEGGISFLLRHAEARVADLVSRSTPPQAVPAQGGVTVGWVLVPEEATEAMWQAGREADEHPGDSYSAAWAAMIAAAPQPDSPAPRAEEPHEGWLYHNPDTGEEWSLNHPVESGEVEDAENIRPATAAILKDMLIQAWDDAEERRGENEEAAQEISRLRDALRRATAPASPDSPAPVASGGEREALVVQAIDAFQKRNGYHKPVILELLEEFGSLLLALATAPHQPATEAAPSPAGMVEEALKGAMRAFLDERDRWADSRFPYGDERHAYFTLGNLRRLCKAYEALLAHPQEVPAPDQGWQPIKMAPGDGAPVLVGWAGTGFEATKAHCEAGIWGTLDQDMTFRPLDRQPDVFRELPISPLNLPTPPASTEA